MPSCFTSPTFQSVGWWTATVIRRIVARFLAIILVCAACSSPSVAGSPSPTTRLASPTDVATPTSVASASARTTLNPAAGSCTGPNVTAPQLIERLFALSTSRDAGAVLDCYAESKRAEVGFDDFAARWSTSGPASGVAIRFIDRVKGCDRFGTNATLAHGDSVGYFGEHSTFFSIGAEQGVLRIYDAGTALASAEATLITCT